jgi:two-component system, OmpR family, response regulator ChvI
MANLEPEMAFNNHENINNNNNNSANSDSVTSNTVDVQGSKERQSSYRILIVDDEQDIALSYETILEEEGFEVDIFNDPLSALAKIREIHSSSTSLLDSSRLEQEEKGTTTKPYDLLLLDIRMPKMNGFELYREIKEIIKEDKVDNNIKVCFITAYEVYYEQLKEEFPKIDVACFIKKPIGGDDLVKRIKQELLLE